MQFDYGAGQALREAGMTPDLFGVLVVMAAAAGACVGSFLGAALVRLPQGRSIVTGASSCDGCGRKLGPAELVPVVSWLVLRGRCRTCSAAIGPWQLVCELGGAGVAVGALLTAPDPVSASAVAVLGWLLLLLALLDLRHFWLPRALTAVLAVTGLAFALWQAWSLGDALPLWLALGAGLAGYALLAGLAMLYRTLRGRDGLGGGDPPLLGAIGLWVGPVGLIHVLLGASLLGLAAAVAMRVCGRKITAETALPLGTCLAATAWPVFLIGMVTG
ncbi:A24 family peptidase [Novosphingobium sp. FKTRR1]|uniref:prepilin peptidase n=1 Tax=Novosphingobium sp. FKTRR1 TaxID=2879118 RepID=UPI001CF0B6AE|nr:A24 family peptidase [Novosphingobium sp. FKTRR1]